MGDTEYTREWRRLNPERSYQHQKKWRQKNPEAYAAILNRHREKPGVKERRAAYMREYHKRRKENGGPLGQPHARPQGPLPPTRQPSGSYRMSTDPEILRRARDWYAKNRERKIQYNREYRERERANRLGAQAEVNADDVDPNFVPVALVRVRLPGFAKIPWWWELPTRRPTEREYNFLLALYRDGYAGFRPDGPWDNMVMSAEGWVPFEC